MNRADRELLARAVRANQGIAECVNALLAHIEAEHLPVEPLRELAGHLDTLSGALRFRADAIDNTLDVEPGGVDFGQRPPTGTDRPGSHPRCL